ncbi:hypothetical protein OQA88_9632 [Cercophora sp. LCS_1]
MKGRERLAKWAREKGMMQNGIALGDLPGRGVGMVATKKLRAGQTTLHVPLDCIRSLHTVPDHIRRKLPSDFSIPGLLAAELTVDNPVELSAWREIIPSLSTFKASLPFFWSEQLQQLLPEPAKGFERSWFVVSTRTFYYITPETEKYPPEDRIALVPVADMLNHAESGCEVLITTDGFTITSDRAYRPGQEVKISYGGHPNDFLLAEYGFVLSEKK